MILAATDSSDEGARVAVEVRPGDVVYIGRSPFHFGRPPDTGEKILRIPWFDRIVNRHHSVARIGEESAEFELCAPPPGEGPRSPLMAPGVAAGDGAARVRAAIGEAVGIGKRPRTFLCLCADAAQVAALGSDAGQVAEDAGDGVPHLVRVQLKLFQDELPRRLARWRSAEELFDRAAGFLEMAARNLGAARSVWAFHAPAGGGGALEPLTSDHTAIAGFRVCESIVAAARGQADAGLRTWGGGQLPKPADLGREADAVVCGMLSAPVPQGDAAAAFLYRGRPILLYGEIRGADPACVDVLGRIATVVARLVAALLGAHEHLRREEQMKAYFSPRVRSHVTEHPEKLRPAIHPCTVLFCDRRSSSRIAEAAGTDAEVLELLRRNQEILGRVTDVVFRRDGAVADFAGDCVLGYWGWPPGEGEPDHARQAVRAAEEIVRSLADLIPPGDERLPVCRVGISTGPMAVGNVGPPQQMKISLFGNPVNFAARLEGLGKKFRVPVLLSEETAHAVHDGGEFRVRRLCRLRPAGFQRAYPIYELVLPRELLGSGATIEQIALYESALRCFERRAWDEAEGILRQLPADDEPAFWLSREVARCREQPPPAQWQGEIEANEK